MTKRQRNRGFSLTEVLMAVGTLAIGLTFIGGTFLAGIHMTTISTERTTAAVVADEAFAKIRLFGVDVTDPNLPIDEQIPFDNIQHPLTNSVAIDPNEYSYPSIRIPWEDKQYFWSALCRKMSADPADRLVQVTIFVSRKVLRTANYYGGSGFWPVPVEVPISFITGTGNENKLIINDSAQRLFISDGSTVIDNATGRIYRVLERDPAALDVIILDAPWQGGTSAGASVWVVPPPINGGRKPCIAVYQRLIRF